MSKLRPRIASLNRLSAGGPQTGFTLIELLVVLALISIMATISVTSYSAYNKAVQPKGAVRESVAYMRNAQVKAVTEARTWECRFSSTKLEIYSPTGLYRQMTLPANLRYVASGAVYGFAHDGNSHNTNCFFYAKGTATPGKVAVQRIDNSAIREIQLEGLTSRISYCNNAGSNSC